MHQRVEDVSAVPVRTPGRAGLTDQEVQARLAAGQGNQLASRASRTVGEILRANLLTRFNAILGVLLVVALVIGPFQDALFGIVLAVNALIGIAQELRAKRGLDRLALLTAPTARVVRASGTRDVPAAEVVIDDILLLNPGDQIVVDGAVLSTDGLEVDESLLTGEAEAVAKEVGSEVLSGSFVTAGTGSLQARRVGEQAYAQRLQEDARRFSLVQSQLQAGINRILRIITWVMIPAAGLLISGQLLRSNEGLSDALRGSVAGVGSMVPEGLVLLTTIAFALGALRLAGRRVLVQELAAIEGLARVDVVCVDKTGTLTEPGMAVDRIEPLGPLGPPDLADPLGILAAADPSPNASLAAIGAACPAPAGWVVAGRVPFSSARKWSAVTLPDGTSWYLGAPEILLDRVVDPGELPERIGQLASGGERVLLVARSSEPPVDAVLPRAIEPSGVVVLAERLRPDAPQTVRYLLDQGVAIKVLSGDDPRTVAAVAGRAGVPEHGAPFDARGLPDENGEPDALAEVLEAHAVFGRVRPDQKRAMVRALQRRGHVVAMTGDGVNDVPALKIADLGIAMGTGSPASRAVGRIVLLDSSFAAFPIVVGEGRRVIANIERVANLFVTKTVYATLLAVAVGAAGLPFPFYPRHLTVVSSLTIGIPGFFLALAPNAARARPGFLARVLRFTVPAGTVAAAATLAAYAVARSAAGTTQVQARTVATMALFAVAMWVLVLLARPLNGLRRLLLAGLAAAFVAILAFERIRRFFDFSVPGTTVLAATAAIVAASLGCLTLAGRLISRP